MEARLRCKLNLGMFSGEVAVCGRDAYGTEFSLFADRDFVETDMPITGVQAVDGWLRVDVLAREGNLMLVRLPAQTFENGQTITVRDSQVEPYRPRVAV